jgi:hypothetical protein
MEYLLDHTILPYLKNKFALNGTIKSLVLHTAGIGESQIDEWISDLEECTNPTVGLLAHPGQVDIRITAKANSVEEANRMITTIETQIRSRMGDHIFGSAGEKLEDHLSAQLQNRGWKIAVLECGLEGLLVSRLAAVGSFSGRSVESSDCNIDLRNQVDKLCQQFDVEVGIGASLERGQERQVLHMVIISPNGIQETTRSWGGSPALANLWAANITLDFIRRNIE